MSLYNKIFTKFAGYSITQKFLENATIELQQLMGIGMGGNVKTSGELIALKILKKNFDPPYTIFDVGANKGQYCNMVLNYLSNDDISIHCFEPCSYTFSLLKKHTQNYDNSNRKKIFINNHSLGRYEGTHPIYYDQKGSGLASFSKRKLDHFGIKFDLSEQVEVGTVENYCRTNSVSMINLLKLDVEGHELDVLLGGYNMLRDGMINTVVFEFGGCNIDSRTYFQDFYYFFKDINMKLFRITPSGYLHVINSYKELYEQFVTTNFLAIYNGLSVK